MYQKITIILTILFTAVLFYLANKYNAVGEYKFAFAKDFVPYYELAINQFSVVGSIFCFAIWIWVDVVIIKTKQFFWLIIPFLFIVIVALTYGNQSEKLFHFKKTNGLWDGSFSLSGIISYLIIIVAAFVMAVNYFGFKIYFKKQKNNSS